MPVIFFVRQPPPSTTARHDRDPLGKSCWQKTFQPAATVPSAPKTEHGRPAAGVSDDGADVAVVVGALELVTLVVVGGVVVLGGVVVVGASMLLDVGGATLTVVTAMVAGAGAVVVRVRCVVVARTGAFDAALGRVPEVGVAGVVMLGAVVADAAGDSAIDDNSPDDNSPDDNSADGSSAGDWPAGDSAIEEAVPEP